MSEQTEYRLLERARGGERSAFEELQVALDAPARRFIRRLIGLSDMEDDIIQNAFFALYMNLDRLDTGEKLRPFLFRVLRNQCYDELRWQGRYDTVSLDEDAEDTETMALATTPETGPDETTHWLLIYGEVQDAIARLPELQRQTLLLYTEVDLSYAEIADAMSVSIGTVKSRLFHARTTLLRMLRPETRVALGVGGEAKEEEETDDE